MPLGRRDGLVSSASDATSLPSPTDSVAVQRQKFADKGLTDHDLVTLVGNLTCHSHPCDMNSSKFPYQIWSFRDERILVDPTHLG